MSSKFSSWVRSGEPWIWINAGAVSLSIIAVLGLLLLIAVRGLGHFWPHAVLEVKYHETPDRVVQVIGEVHDQEEVTGERLRAAGVAVPAEVVNTSRYLVKVGNRETYGSDFRWLAEPLMEGSSYPAAVMVLERREWGNFFGYLKSVQEGNTTVAEGEAAWDALQERIQRARDIYRQIRDIETGEIGTVNYAMERLRLKQRRLELDGKFTPAAGEELAAKRQQLEESYGKLQVQLSALYDQVRRDHLTATIADGSEVTIEVAQVVRAYRPNALHLGEKLSFYAVKLWEFVSEEPREANTEGGIFPAIFGTVMMVFLMSLMVTPFGVVAAVYLREYAKQGPLTRLIRIAVNNLAGVPSIVYGVFGLGFFVYLLGGNIDRLFFPEALPAPTFGTPGILWASLTLAILTVPVVIVATEEGLSRIPRSIREGSLALGATKAETLWRTVLPMASPAMMTGIILAIARAAGEVAPLMLVGVVKLAPSLPLDGNAPFLHLERKFMHLGFHIYDVGFQSPNVEAARPLVYATSLLLVFVIVVLNLAAITIRNRLREKYRALEH